VEALNAAVLVLTAGGGGVYANVAAVPGLNPMLGATLGAGTCGIENVVPVAGLAPGEEKLAALKLCEGAEATLTEFVVPDAALGVVGAVEVCATDDGRANAQFVLVPALNVEVPVEATDGEDDVVEEDVVEELPFSHVPKRLELDDPNTVMELAGAVTPVANTTISVKTSLFNTTSDAQL
jgi:hypothetical protein